MQSLIFECKLCNNAEGHFHAGFIITPSRAGVPASSLRDGSAWGCFPKMAKLWKSNRAHYDFVRTAKFFSLFYLMLPSKLQLIQIRFAEVPGFLKQRAGCWKRALQLWGSQHLPSWNAFAACISPVISEEQQEYLILPNCFCCPRDDGV